jgi:hypothetical protein
MRANWMRPRHADGAGSSISPSRFSIRSTRSATRSRECCMRVIADTRKENISATESCRAFVSRPSSSTAPDLRTNRAQVLEHEVAEFIGHRRQFLFRTSRGVARRSSCPTSLERNGNTGNTSKESLPPDPFSCRFAVSLIMGRRHCVHRKFPWSLFLFCSKYRCR